MVAVRLLVGRAGHGFDQKPGDVVEVEQAEAVRMIERGQAAPVREAEPERTVRKPKAEKASR